MTKTKTNLIQIPRGVWILGFVSLLMDVSSEMIHMDVSSEMIHSLLPLFMVTTLGASAFSVGIIEGLAESTALVVKVSDRISHRAMLALGLIILIAADLVLATNDHWGVVFAGVALWGIHMGITQGLLATMVADTAPADLRGTAYGFFNLVSGLAMLIASIVAGLAWDRLGASFTFYAGAVFCGIALMGLAWQPITQAIKKLRSSIFRSGDDPCK